MSLPRPDNTRDWFRKSIFGKDTVINKKYAFHLFSPQVLGIVYCTIKMSISHKAMITFCLDITKFKFRAFLNI